MCVAFFPNASPRYVDNIETTLSPPPWTQHPVSWLSAIFKLLNVSVKGMLWFMSTWMGNKDILKTVWERERRKTLN